MKKGVPELKEKNFVNKIYIECYFKTQRGYKKPDFKLEVKLIEVEGKKQNIVRSRLYYFKIYVLLIYLVKVTVAVPETASN